MGTNSPYANLPRPSLTDTPNAPAAFESLTNALDLVVLPKFPNATARDAAIPAPTDGQHAYLTDSHTLTVYRSHVAQWVTYSYALPPKIDVYSTAGAATWTKPTGARSVWVRVLGGGGAGGGAVGGGGQACSGSGGAGGYCESWYDAAALPATVAVTVGAAGVSAAGAVGGNGGASSFGSLMTANGGDGGAVGTNSTSPTTANPGVGGTATGGNIVNTQGESGATGQVMSGAQYTFFQKGANSEFGSGGGAALTVNSNGESASGFGAGGGNAVAGGTSRAGGNGTRGIVIVVTYF